MSLFCLWFIFVSVILVPVCILKCEKSPSPVLVTANKDERIVTVDSKETDYLNPVNKNRLTILPSPCRIAP
jgi:hypothetical protein